MAQVESLMIGKEQEELLFIVDPPSNANAILPGRLLFDRWSGMAGL
jgi:hypothetical protein